MPTYASACAYLHFCIYMDVNVQDCLRNLSGARDANICIRLQVCVPACLYLYGCKCAGSYMCNCERVNAKHKLTCECECVYTGLLRC